MREALGIRPGQKLHAIECRGHIELVPVKSMKSARGSLKGISSEVPRRMRTSRGSQACGISLGPESTPP